MKTTPNSIKLHVRLLISKARNNALELTSHRACTVRANPDQLHPPTWVDNIKNAHDEVKHVLASVCLVHWDGKEMKVVEFPLDVDSNTVVEI